MRPDETWENEEYRCQLCMQLFAAETTEERTPLIVCENVHNFCAKCCGKCTIATLQISGPSTSVVALWDPLNTNEPCSPGVPPCMQVSSRRGSCRGARSAASRCGPTPSPTGASSACSRSCGCRVGAARPPFSWDAARLRCTRSSAPIHASAARCTQVGSHTDPHCTHALPGSRRSTHTQARIARMRCPVRRGRLTHRPALHACAARFAEVDSHTGPHCTHALPGSQRSTRSQARIARMRCPVRRGRLAHMRLAKRA